VVKKGTTGHLYAAKNLRDAKVLVLDKETACVLEVAQGRPTPSSTTRCPSLALEAQRGNDAAVLTPFQQESWAVGLRLGDDALRVKVNAFIQSYRESGGFRATRDKWLPEQKAEFKRLGIPFFF